MCMVDRCYLLYLSTRLSLLAYKSVGGEWALFFVCLIVYYHRTYLLFNPVC